MERRPVIYLRLDAVPRIHYTGLLQFQKKAQKGQQISNAR